MEDPGQLPRLIAGPTADLATDLALDLALDELLVSRAEALARVWSPPGRAAVIGVGSKAAAELDLEACRADGLRVLRRMTGGSAVLVTPEVACFSLVFPHALFPDAKRISGAYGLATTLTARALGELGLSAEFEPPGDLAIGGRKLVGFAQARRRRATLVHGVIPVALDLTELERYLAHPPREPAYRAGRAHEEFVTTVAMSVERHAPELGSRPVEDVLGALGLAFCGRGASGEPPREDELAEAAPLVREKYTNDGWTFRR